MSEKPDAQRDEYDKRYIRVGDLVFTVVLICLAGALHDGCQVSQLRDLQRRVGAIESQEGR